MANPALIAPQLHKPTLREWQEFFRENLAWLSEAKTQCMTEEEIERQLQKKLHYWLIGRKQGG